MQHQSNKVYTRDDILNWSVEYFVTLPLAEQDMQNVLVSLAESCKQCQQEKSSCEQKSTTISDELRLLSLSDHYRGLSNQINEKQKTIASQRAEINELEQQMRLCLKRLTYLEKKSLYLEANTIVSNLSHQIETANSRLDELDEEIERLVQYKKSYLTQAAKIDNTIDSTKLMLLEWQEKSPSLERNNKIAQLQQMLATFQEGANAIHQKQVPIMHEYEQKLQLMKQLEAQVAEWKSQAEVVSQKALDEFLPLQHQFPGASGLLNKEQLLQQRTTLTERLRNESQSLLENMAMLENLQQRFSEIQLLPIGKYINMTSDEIALVEAELRQSAQSIVNEMTGIAAREQQCLASIQELNTQMQANRSRKQELAAMRLFMNLFDHPKEMMIDCMVLINDEVKDYEWLHPIGQHESVRALMHERLALFDKINSRSAESNDLDVFINHYLILIGWLHDAYDRSHQNDTLFADKLNRILSEHPFDKQEALQDFAKIRREIQINDLAWQEVAVYNEILIQLQSKINAKLESVNHAHYERELYLSANKLLKEISAHVGGDPSSGRDLKYFTTLLKACDKVLDNPFEATSIDAFKHFADFNVIGNAVEKHQLRGALLMFVSAAIALVSFTIGIISLGIMTPLSIAGFSVSAALLTMGAGCMVYGRQKGIDRSLTLFHDNAKHGLVQSIKTTNPVLVS